MQVRLVTFTPDADLVVASAARLCYSKKSITEIYDFLNANPEETQEYVQKLLDMGHESPFEHVDFTFAIDGVSRAYSHQHVRHRIASYSQKSQRYVKETQFSYITPPAIEKNAQAKAIYAKLMEQIQTAYNQLLGLGIEGEDARYVLPNACETQIVVTMNARALFNFFSLRCCSRAQHEIRAVANEMLKLVKEVAPVIFKNAGPSCVTLGYCPEADKSCGRAPTLKELKQAYAQTAATRI